MKLKTGCSFCAALQADGELERALVCRLQREELSLEGGDCLKALCRLALSLWLGLPVGLEERETPPPDSVMLQECRTRKVSWMRKCEERASLHTLLNPAQIFK